MDTDQQKATAGWLSWLQQPTSRAPRSIASRTLSDRSQAIASPTRFFDPETLLVALLYVT